MYFVSVLLIYTLIAGSIMMTLGSNIIKTTASDQVMARAKRISKALSELLVLENELTDSVEAWPFEQDSVDQKHMNKRRGQGQKNQEQTNMMDEAGMKQHGPMRGRSFISPKVLDWVSDLLLSDVYLVDLKEGSIASKSNSKLVNLDELDSQDKTLVEQAFENQTVANSNFSLLEQNTAVHVATPLYLDNEIVGAVFITESLAFTEDLLSQSLLSLALAFLVGLILVSLLAVFFAKRFIKPIESIDQMTQSLIDGQYQLEQKIKRDDEIGQLADRLGMLAKRLDEASEQAKTLDNMRDDFISSMSHELKTPVAVIKMSLEALIHKVVTEPEEISSYIDVIYNESIALEKLINELSSLNMLRNPKLKLNKSQLNLIDPLEDAIRSQKLVAESQGIRIEKEIAHPFIDFEGDYSRLRQLFVILIDNAIKYAKKNSQISIKEYKEDQTHIISITNYGTTIAKDVIDFIFEPFYRDKNNSKQGFGLGLAIAKEVAIRHNMKIDVKSDQGQTTFKIIINKE